MSMMNLISYYLISVQTLIEIVKNKTYYEGKCSNIIGPINDALRRICNNYSFCELYEIIALANVLQCEVQSVYPYIDYRAEMKCMNAVYKPTGASNSNNGRVIIFWTSCEDELSTKTRPDNNCVWSPNHFVPLIEATRGSRTASTEQANATPEVKYTTV